MIITEKIKMRVGREAERIYEEMLKQQREADLENTEIREALK